MTRPFINRMEARAFRIQSRGHSAAKSRVAVPNLFSGEKLARIAPWKRFAREDAMAVVALKKAPQLKMFYATVHVTRVEEWCVEAENAEEARELLAAGSGYRTHIGDCVNLDVERIED